MVAVASLLLCTLHQGLAAAMLHEVGAEARRLVLVLHQAPAARFLHMGSVSLEFVALATLL